MKDTYCSAKLLSGDTIRIVIFSSFPTIKLEPVLFVDGVKGRSLTFIKQTSLPSILIADFRSEEPLILGRSYFVTMPQYGMIPLDVSDAMTFPRFDEDYLYEGDDLGCTYAKTQTRFVLWAPLASKVSLCLRQDPEHPFEVIPMVRSPKGVYRATVKGDVEGYEYVYWVVNNEVGSECTDPYAKGSTLNSRCSVVVDFSKLQVDFKRECLPVLSSPSEAIIYETHVRDFTIDSHSDIVHKGKFLGLIERGRKTEKGHPAGFDHLLSLGITHLQLLPIYDYATVDEEHPDTKYNWGYDPAQYFVPEGSYASDLHDPLSRIKDLQELVKTCHENGIRVVMDVVYNHVYEQHYSLLERVVPNYYFRHRHNGTLTNCSGCGDDLATERPMVRKFVLDCCKWWQKTYGIDGFRFDLMGIIDGETLLRIEQEVKAVDPSFLLYGEGWNMGSEVPSGFLGTMGNYAKLPNFGFFNDFYREKAKNYASGNLTVTQEFKNAYLGSCTDFLGPKRFLTANQSLNYAECHDDATLFDFLAHRRSDLSKEEILKIVVNVNTTILLSFGIPFIHMGQEIGQDKKGEHNTYNKGDEYNKLRYDLLDERYEMVEDLKKAIVFRKSNRFLYTYAPELLDEFLAVYEDQGMVEVTFTSDNFTAPKKGLIFYINPTEKSYTKDVGEAAKVLLSPHVNPEPLLRDGLLNVPPRSLIVLINHK